MRSSSSSIRQTVGSLLKCTFLGLLLITVSACFRSPTTIPDGYGEVFKDPARSGFAARVDWPVTAQVDPNATSINFRVSKFGERFWFWEGPFWNRPFMSHVTWYRVSLIAREKDEAVCVTDWAKPGDEDVLEVPCRFSVNGYLAKPLIAMLDYWVGGDENAPPGENVPATGEVDRLYYFIPNN